MEEQQNQPCIEGGQTHCSVCARPLCLRKQVINLALGHVERMFCLVCLGNDSGREPDKVLEGIKGYINSRECFKREWVKYPNMSHCPEPEACFPDLCFASEDE